MNLKTRRTAGAAVLAAALLAGGSGIHAAATPAAAAESAPAKKIDDPASIGVQEARTLIAERKDLLLVDVRSPLEFSQGFIAGSQNIPFIDVMEGRHALAKQRPLLLICSIGGRSFAAVQLLQEKGYMAVYNLDGGLQAWRHAALPLQASNTK